MRKGAASLTARRVAGAVRLAMQVWPPSGSTGRRRRRESLAVRLVDEWHKRPTSDRQPRAVRLGTTNVGHLSYAAHAPRARGPSGSAW